MNFTAKAKSLDSHCLKKTRWLTCLLLLGFSVLGTQRLMQAAGSPGPCAGETVAQRDARMAWRRGARFGMFIHWGVSSVPAGEWNGKRVGGGGAWIRPLRAKASDAI